MEISHTKKHYPLSDHYLITAKWDRVLPSDQKEIREWCINTFGKSGWREDLERNRWLDDIENNEIVFVDESDFTVFLLRWG